MFGWFKSKDEKNADKVLAMLARAIGEVHPDRFSDPLDAALVIQPRLAQLNLLLGTENDERFAPVSFDDLVACISVYESKGLVRQLGTAVADEAVLLAILSSAIHEMHGTTKRSEVRERAEFLLNCINTKIT